MIIRVVPQHVLVEDIDGKVGVGETQPVVLWQLVDGNECISPPGDPGQDVVPMPGIA